MESNPESPTGRKGLQKRISAMLSESGKPLNFEQIYACLLEDGQPLPEEKPKLVVRKILYGSTNLFQANTKGLFRVKDENVQSPAKSAPSTTAAKQEQKQAAEETPSTGLQLKERIFAVLREAGKPLDFEKIFACLAEDGISMPAEKPKLVVRKTLYNETYFTTKGKGFFGVREDVSLPAPDKSAAVSSGPKVKQEQKQAAEEPSGAPSKKELTARIFAVLSKAGKPLDFEKIFACLAEDGKPMPAEKPKLVVRKMLYNETYFTAKGKGFFDVKEGASPPAIETTASAPAKSEVKPTSKEPTTQSEKPAEEDTVVKTVKDDIKAASRQAAAQAVKEVQEEARKHAAAVQQAHQTAIREAREAAAQAAREAAKEIAEEARKVTAQIAQEAAEEARRAATQMAQEAANTAREAVAKQTASTTAHIQSESYMPANSSAGISGKESIRERIASIILETGKPMSLDDIYMKLKSDGFSLPQNKPKIVVERVLNNKKLFGSTPNGLFVPITEA